MSLILDGTNGLSDVDGTAGTPAIRGSDANTGVFFGTDIVGVSTGGSERVRVDASGNVGIGTSSITNPYSQANFTDININGVWGGIISFKLGGVEQGWIGQQNSGNGNMVVGASSGQNLLFATNGNTERMRIDSSGNLLVGATSNSSYAADLKFYVDTSSQNCAGFRTNAGNATDTPVGVWNTATSGTRQLVKFFVSGGIQIGSITSGGTSTSYNTSSDYRLKENIAPMTGALAKVAALKPVTYTWKVDGSAGQGFIAHELQEVVPDCVVGEKDAVDAEGNPQYQGIDTSFLAGLYAAALQELKAINDAQAQTIESLTARVVALEGQA